MNDAFVLGAGFSIAIDSLAMPDTNELGRRVLKVQRAIHRSRVPSHSQICDGISCDSPILRAPDSTPENFESWLGTLAEPQPYLFGPDNDRRHALFAELTGLISGEIESAVALSCPQPAPQWLNDLVNHWHLGRAEVMTFNYDTLVEATVENLPLNAPSPSGLQRVTHMQIGPSVIPSAIDMHGGTRLRPLQTFRYHKLHGSTNWYWDETTRAADSIVQVGLRSTWLRPDPLYDDEELKYLAPGKAPMIVPPTAGKTVYFDNPVIRFLWREAYRVLRSARRIFVIGYSLPPADLLVRSMFEAALDTRDVWIVNPDTSVADRFEKLGALRIHRDFCSSGDRLIEAFGDWYDWTA